MTSHQINIVKRSWRSLRGIDPVLLGDIFYTKLFIDHPSLERLFKTSKQEQSKKLMDMFDTLIRSLEHLEDMRTDLSEMAMRHVQYGVKPKHYAQVGAALLWTLQTSLGRDWTPEVAEAWLVCYNELTQLMLSGLGKQTV